MSLINLSEDNSPPFPAVVKPEVQTFAYQVEPPGCCGKISVEEILTGKFDIPTLVAEEKKEDIRYYLQIRPQGATINYLTSRRISVVTGKFVEKQDKVPKIRDFQFPDFLADSIFDGGAHGDGLSSDTQHDMVTGNVEYTVWAIRRLGGQDLTSLPRDKNREILVGLSKWFPSWLKVIEEGVPSELLKKVRVSGGEGIILKERGAAYGKQWFKVKEEEMFDVLIWGYLESDSKKYAPHGWIKSVCFGQWLEIQEKEFFEGKGNIVPSPGCVKLINGRYYKFIDCGRTSGMNEIVRDKISKDRMGHLGKALEIKTQLRLPSLKFRHPRFSRFREDKNPDDCVYREEEA